MRLPIFMLPISFYREKLVSTNLLWAGPGAVRCRICDFLFLFCQLHRRYWTELNKLSRLNRYFGFRDIVCLLCSIFTEKVHSKKQRWCLWRPSSKHHPGACFGSLDSSRQNKILNTVQYFCWTKFQKRRTCRENIKSRGSATGS